MTPGVLLPANFYADADKSDQAHIRKQLKEARRILNSSSSEEVKKDARRLIEKYEKQLSTKLDAAVSLADAIVRKDAERPQDRPKGWTEKATMGTKAEVGRYRKEIQAKLSELKKRLETEDYADGEKRDIEKQIRYFESELKKS